MDSKTAAPSGSMPKKYSKGKIHIPRAPKPCTPEQLLADEKAAHNKACVKLDAALAQLQSKEREYSNNKDAMKTLQQQMVGLSAELLQTQIQMRSQKAEACDVAAALDARVTDMSARLLAKERALQQQKRSAAHELAAQKQQAAVAKAELSRLQLAHADTLVKLVKCRKASNGCISALQQQLQDKGASLSAAEACKLAALNDLAAEKRALQAANSHIAVLQQQVAVAQDSLAQLQYIVQAAQDDVVVQKHATHAAEAQMAELQLNLEYVTASRSETQRRCELLSADLAAHNAAASTAECSIASLHVQLQESRSRCKELEVAHQAKYDDLARQTSAAAVASAAAYSSRVQELESLLLDAEDQLFDWACAAAVTAVSATSSASSPADTVNGVFSNAASAVLLHCSLPNPSRGGSSQRGPSVSTELGWKPLAKRPFNNVPDQQLPISADQDVPVAAYDKLPSNVLLASQTLALNVARDSTTRSEVAIRASELCKSMLRGLGVFCSGGFSRGSNSPQALDELLTHHDAVGNSCAASRHTSTWSLQRTSLNGVADAAGDQTGAATQGKYLVAAEAEVAATVTGKDRGITGSAAVAAMTRLCRWRNAAARTGIAEYSTPGTSPDIAESYNFAGPMHPRNATAKSLVAGMAIGSTVDTDYDDDNDLAVNGETAEVTIIEQSVGGKARPPEGAAVTDVVTMAGM